MHDRDAALPALPYPLSTAPHANPRRLRTLLLASVAVFGAGPGLAPSSALAACVIGGPTVGIVTATCSGATPDGVLVQNSGTNGLSGVEGTFPGGPGGNASGTGTNAAGITLTGGTTIGTSALNVPAIWLQSLGGTGGNGGAGGFGENSFEDGGSGGQGGDGVAGGSAGSISVTTAAAIVSRGTGLLVESRGGNGGNGGQGGSGGSSIAGRGGNGANGGNSSHGGSSDAIAITSTGDINSLTGDGIYAISSGGAGGNRGGGGGGGGGSGSNGSNGRAGTAGNGGIGGAVTVTSAGDISATGGTGIRAGSFGGSHDDGGTGGSGDDVMVSSSGDIDGLFAIQAQSEGPGGSGNVTIDVTGGIITTNGVSSTGGPRGAIIAQSRNGDNPSASAFGPAGDVTVKVGATVTINHSSDEISAIFAMSQSGKGVTGAAGADGSNGPDGAPIAAGNGGDGGDGGDAKDGGDGFNGGDVSVSNAGRVSTSGNNAAGIDASSIGGDGGDGGQGGGGGRGGAGGFGFTSGGNGGNGGDGGNGGNGGLGGNGGTITITNAGDITTTGRSSHGIVALSQGGVGSNGGNVGGGGNGGGGGGFLFGGPSGGSGVSGANGASGSAGNGGNGGAITITSSGDISASGVDSWGISASGYGSSGDIAIDIKDGTVSGGAGELGFAGGISASNASGGDVTITNAGTVSAVNGGAIWAEGAIVQIVNTGTVIGDVTMAGATSSVFDNAPGGRFESGATVDVGSNGALNSSGTVSPGGNGTLQTTTLTGNFIQTSGVLQVDADWTGNSGAGASDKLVVSGSADLDGSVVVNPLNFPSPSMAANTGLTKTFNILTAMGTITNSGITVVDTAAVDYSLLVGPHDVDLTASINFLGVDPGPEGEDGGGIKGLTSNQTAVGTALNKIVGGGGSLPFVPSLMTLSTQDELSNALDQLSPAGDGGSVSSALSTGQTFAGQLLSCRVAGDDGDANAIIREGQCVWARANVRHTENNAGDQVGFEETAAFYSAGAQFDIGGPWRVGIGGGFETADLSTDSRAQAEADRVHVGGVLKYNPGPLLLAAALTGGSGSNDNRRLVAFGPINDVATSESDSTFLTGRLTAAYLLNYGSWYAKPQIDAALTNFDRDGYTETAASGVGLNVTGSNDTIFSVSPALEVGAQYLLPSGGTARPYVKAGFTWVDSDTFTTTAEFAGAPAGSAPFAITTTIDDVLADIGAGVDLIGTDGLALRIQYDGRFGEDTDQHGGAAKLSVPF